MTNTLLILNLRPTNPMRNGSETSRRGGTGRRAGLKIQYSQECVGSNPSAGSTFAVRRRKSETNTKC